MKDLTMYVPACDMASQAELPKLLRNGLRRLGINAKVYRYHCCKVKFKSITDMHLILLSGLLIPLPGEYKGHKNAYIYNGRL
jgi:hypothetical protein